MDTAPILSNRFAEGYFDQTKSLLVLQWFASTYDLQSEEYKVLVLEIADLIKENKIQRWMSYSKDFAFVITPVLQEWIAGEFNQKLLDGGLQKLAVIIPSNYIVHLSVQQAMDEIEEQQQDGAYKTQYFENYEQAEKWLLNE